MEAEGQQPAVESIVHQLVKPATKTVAWGAVALAFGALVAGSVRNLRED